MPFYILSIVIEVALVVHVIKTGRSYIWIWVIILLPMVGMLAYLIVEILPELMAGKTARRMGRGIQGVVNPNKDINQASQNFAVADTVENSMRLAEECLKKQRYSEAKELYDKALKGIHADDPDLMFGLARAEFGLNHYAGSKSILDELIEKNPNYKNPHAHLLYAKSLDALGENELALDEYKVLDGYYPGPQASYHYAMLLQKQGQEQEAKAVFEKIINLSKTSGKHYNTIHKEWISKTKEALRG